MQWSGWRVFPCEPRDGSLRPMGEGRPPGLHLGQIIQRMRVAVGEASGDVPGDQPNVRMQEGFLWEAALEYVVSGMSVDEALEVAFKRYMVAIRSGIARQVSVQKDDIWMTPDAFNGDRGEIESYKVTRKKLQRSQDEFESSFWAWVVQEKAYCLAMGVDTVRWVVLFQAGDYSRGPGSGPQMLESTGTFTPEELVENWRIVMKHAEGIRGLKVSPPTISPPLLRV
jgi:hypothetical protein